MATDLFHQRIQPVVNRIQGFDHRGVTPYIHCSKINSIWVAMKQVPVIVRQTQSSHVTNSFTAKQVNAVVLINSILNQFDELQTRCARDTCVPLLLATSVSSVKHEIASMRDALAAAFGQLNYPDIAKLFRIAKQDLDDQNMVDMKRIVQVLMQIGQMKRDDALDNLSLRFESLRQLGLEVGLDDSVNITIPELPANLRILVKHDEIAIGKQIGSGQSGVVKLGIIKATNEQVAVKILHKRALTQPELESFRREIYALSVLNHPSLLQFKGYTEESPFFIITEYMENGSLFDLIRSKPALLTPTIRSAIAYDVATGLAYLHAKGIIHRDMKSLNVLLDSRCKAKICDFGMIRTKSAAPMTGLIGTAHWMAPEVLMSAPDYDCRVDVYSFGIFMWELLTGQGPYRSMKQADITLGIMSGTLRPPIPADCPDPVRDLIEVCWAQDPAHRPMMPDVVARLATAKCHFVGTVESEFNTLVGIDQPAKHKPRKRKHRRVEPGGIVSLLQSSKGEAKEAVIEQLITMLNDTSAVEQLVSTGGCSVIAKLLTEQREAVVSALAECNCPAIFDVEVLKALLGFSSVPDFALRMKALASLIVASGLRFELLSSAPAFLAQLLAFFRQQIDPDQATALLNLTKQLLSTYSQINDGIVPLLFWVLDNHDVHQSLIVRCLAQAAKFQSACREFTEPYLVRIAADLGRFKRIVYEYCEHQASIPNDQILVNALWARRSASDSFALLCDIAARPRFASLIITLLPAGGDTRVASAIYLPFLSVPDFYPLLVQIPEFYAVASYFVASNKFEQICTVLKQCTVIPAILTQTRLCEFLARAFSGTAEEAGLISLMAAIFSISRTVVVQDFVELLPKLFEFLIGQAALRKPAFLCIAALACYNVKDVDYDRLTRAASFYVNSESPLMREFSAVVIKDHVTDPGVDIDQCVAIFAESFGEVDKYVKVALDAFRKAGAAMSDSSRGVISRLRKRHT
jgi:serine/threonine protein kinase